MKIDINMFKIKGIKLSDKGYYINLNKSAERRNNVETQIKKYNIEGLYRFEALTDEHHQFSCTKSHLQIFKDSLEEGLDVIFVAEDDFQINDFLYQPNLKNKLEFNDMIYKISKDMDNVEWDVIMFGCNPKTHMIPVTNTLAKIYKSTGAWAYLIKKRAYKYILENSNYKKDWLAIDDYLPHLNKFGFKTLTTIPSLINHAVGFESTLDPKGLVNYDNWIQGNYRKFIFDRFPNNKFTENKIQKNLTIVITGHFVENFTFYLRYLIHSLPNELKICRFIINYDYDDQTDLNLFKHKIFAFFRDIGGMPDLNVDINFSYGGLISSIQNSIEKIKTNYFLFLEHDWVFLNKNDINFLDLITAFDNNEFVNAVWFSKDDNVMRGFDIETDVTGNVTPFEVDKGVKELKLITTCRWTNNPGIFRLDKYKEWFSKYIKNEYIGEVNQGPHNVEETMISIYRNDIKNSKWVNVKDKWGTYLYGGLGDGPYVGHTDASKRYQGHSKSQPEINGENYIKNNPL